MRLASSAPTRLYFLDWVRIIAFFVLIVYHVGMYYVTWDWHVKSPYASDAMEPLMMLSSPWRLGLLFLISGVASRFMLAKISGGQFLRQRSWRLLLPLLFGMAVIVPPQPFFEVIEKLGYSGSYGDFMGLYFHAYHGFCKSAGDCLDLPTWNHLWFVAYLWIYTLALTGIVALLGARFHVWSERLAQWLSKPALLLVPIAVLAAGRIYLLPLFPSTHALVGDWYNHFTYFFLFLTGALLAPHAGVWTRLEALRWPAFAAALAGWATLMIFFSLPEGVLTAAQLAVVRPIMRTVYALCQWLPIVAVCGFAHRHLQFDSPRRRYLTQAVFPVYMLHQTLIVSIAHLIKPARLAPALESVILIVLTLSFSFAVFELVRRSAVLGPLFGVGRESRPQAATTSRAPVASAA